MIYWVFLSCVDTKVQSDTSATSNSQPSVITSGHCEEPDISHLPNGSIDCPEDKCFVPEGLFWMGSSLSIDECPVHQITLDDY